MSEKNRVLFWAMLGVLLISKAAFGQQCGVEIPESQTRRLSGSPYQIVSIKDAYEVSPGHWKSDARKGGRILVSFGEPIAEVGARVAGVEVRNAIVNKTIVDAWKGSTAPLSFSWGIDSTFNVRFIPAPAPMFDPFSIPDYTLAQNMRISCRGGSWEWNDGDKNWYEDIRSHLSESAFESWRRNSYLAAAGGSIRFQDQRQIWMDGSFGFQTPFDPAYCTGPLLAYLELTNFSEVVIADWKFDVNLYPGAQYINTCE